MRSAFAKRAEPLLALLPDPRGVPLRRQAMVALVVSVGVHVVLLFLGARVLAIPMRSIDFAKPKPKLAPIEIELVPMPKEEPQLFTLNEQARPEYLDSTGLEPAAKSPDIPMFEADQDMAAASLNAPTGRLPVPSMGGRKDMAFTNFKSQTVLLGKNAQPFPQDVRIATAPAPPAALYKPQPVRPEEAEPQPQPPAPETSQKEPLNKMDMAKADEFPLPPEKPPGPEPIMPPAKPVPSADLAKDIPPVPDGAKPGSTGYQPHQEQTMIEGSISNRGAAAVDAVKTPLGVYKKKISEAIGSRWHYYVKQRNDLVTVGVARVNFFVTKDGRIQDVRVVENSSNATFANTCAQSVREAELPPVPSEMFEAMKDGRMENTFTFNLY